MLIYQYYNLIWNFKISLTMHHTVTNKLCDKVPQCVRKFHIVMQLLYYFKPLCNETQNNVVRVLIRACDWVWENALYVVDWENTKLKTILVLRRLFNSFSVKVLWYSVTENRFILRLSVVHFKPVESIQTTKMVIYNANNGRKRFLKDFMPDEPWQKS